MTRPKQLCWGCYYAPEIRDLYPSTSIYARRGVGCGGDSRTPRKATSAPPGSRRKLAVMCRRARRGERVDHPEDARDWNGATLADLADRISRGTRSGYRGQQVPSDTVRSESDALHDDCSELDAPEY